MVCGIQTHASARKVSDELRSLSKACFSSLPLTILQRFKFHKKEFHHDKGTTTCYLYYRAAPSVLKPQFSKLFLMTYCRIALICSSWWNPSGSPLWLNRNQHINDLKQKGSIHIPLDESGMQVANFMRWRCVSIRMTSRICVNILDHLDSVHLNCLHTSEGPQEWNQVQRNYWFHILPFTLLFPLRHPGKHQESIIQEYIEINVRPVHSRLEYGDEEMLSLNQLIISIP